MNRADFIDANVPIYAVGRGHRYKEPCVRILMMVAEHPQMFFTDAEVLQELVHRYLASGRWALGREVLESFGELMHDRVEPVYAEERSPGGDVGQRPSWGECPGPGALGGDAASGNGAHHHGGH